MATFQNFLSFTEAMAEGKFVLDTDVLKIALSNVYPIPVYTQFSQITEISAGNGYTAGGTQATLQYSGQSSGIYQLRLNNVTFTASGGNIGPFQYAILYDDTATNKDLIAFWSRGASTTIYDGDSLTVNHFPGGVIMNVG